MRLEWLYRCPYCCLGIGGVEGRPLLPGQLVVCAGCAAPSRFAGDGERLVRLGPGELDSEMATDLDRVQKVLRSSFDPLRNCAQGFRWATTALCDGCWVGLYPDQVPVRILGELAEVCGLCGGKTISGIFLRMLRRHRDVEPRTVLSVDPAGHDLVAACRRWKGQSGGEGCAACGGDFYNADGSPTCFGCRNNYPYQRELLRRRLLALLIVRGESPKPS